MPDDTYCKAEGMENMKYDCYMQIVTLCHGA